MALDLRLFGTIHVDRVPKVTAELESYATGDADANVGSTAAGEDEESGDGGGDGPPPVDALFVELPDLSGRVGASAGGGSFTPRAALRLYLAAFVRAPAFMLGQFLVLAVHGPLYVALNRSLLPAEMRAAGEVSDRHDLPVHAVDRHPVQAMADAGPGWLLANWTVLAALAWAVPRELAVAAATLLGAALVLYGLFYAARRAFLVLGIPVCLGALVVVVRDAAVPAAGCTLVALATVAVLHRGRNRHMVDRAAALAAEHGYRRGCLLTGKAHLGGVVAAAADRDDVTVTRSLASKWLRRSSGVTVDPTLDAGSGLLAGSADDEPTPVLGGTREAASRRIGAATIDLLVLVPLAAVGSLVSGVAAGLVLGDVTTASVLAGALLTPPLYHVGTETLWGRGVGKRLFGLVVVEADGSPVSVREALARTLLRPVDLLLFGLVMFLSRRRQRLGDHLAGTVVVTVDS